MATDESTVPLSITEKVPQVYIDTDDPKFNKDHRSIKIPIKVQMIGLTKEQLEEYRNSSFWRPLRLFFFVMFWLAWIVMFAAAILIVLLSPKCAAKVEPEWWRAKVSYQIYTPTFYDTNGDGIGDFKGIEKKLNEIRRMGVQNIWVSPVIDTQKDDFLPFDVVDFEKVDERYGSRDDLASLISATHDEGMHFVMDLPISTTSPNHIWFEDAKRGGKYHDFYVWKSDLKDKDSPVATGKNDPLVHNGRQPVLNWSNPEVRTAMFNIAKNYLELGVDGFHIVHINQLMKTENKANQPKAAMKAVEEFTKTLQQYVESRKELNAKKIAVFTTLSDIEKLQIEDYSASNLEYIINDNLVELNTKSCANGMAKCLYDSLSKSLAHYENASLPYVWQITNMDSSRPTSRFDEPTGNLMTFMQLTLPGAVEIYYGQELGLTDIKSESYAAKGLMQWDDSINAGFSNITENTFFTTTTDYKAVNYKVLSEDDHSILRTVKTLMKLRQRDETMVFGKIKFSTTLKNDVLMYSRMRETDGVIVGPLFISILNFGMSDAEVDIKNMLPADKSANHVEVIEVYPRSTIYYRRLKLDLSKSKVQLFPKQGILIKI